MAPSYSPIKSVLVTGANAGIGLETCRQLAKVAGVSKVILGCRSKEKADEAVKKLVEQTGKPATLFDTLIIDTSSNESVMNAVAILPGTIEGLICNAGGIGTTPEKKMEESGALCIFAQNTVGHCVLIEELIKTKKMPPGGGIVMSVSEQARGIPELSMAKPPLLPPGETATTEAHLAALIDGTGIKKFNDEAYGSAKGIGGLYMGHMARKHPSYYFLSVSPGGTAGTNIFSFLGPLGSCLMCLLKCTGQMHTLETGAARYVDSLMDKEHPSGKFYASAKGQVGPLGDQALIWDIYADEVAQHAAYKAVHQYMPDVVTRIS